MKHALEGKRIRLLEMPDDPAPLPVGATGTVEYVANPRVDWDPPHQHRTLMLIPGIDRWEVLS